VRLKLSSQCDRHLRIARVNSRGVRSFPWNKGEGAGPSDGDGFCPKARVLRMSFPLTICFARRLEAYFHDDATR
jgi:hypothetical protein